MSLPCLSNECQMVPDITRRLRSSDTFTCVMPWTGLDDMLYAAASLRVLILPAALHLMDNYVCFKHVCLIDTVVLLTLSVLSAMYIFSYALLACLLAYLLTYLLAYLLKSYAPPILHLASSEQ